ncbi:hypothetical protein CL656_05325 [bacterium]|nr:hypothetical protein [bacterium]
MNIDIILNNNKYKNFLNNNNNDNNDNNDNNINEKNTCLISQDIISNNFNKITLPCNHSFDYSNLYNEIYNQKYYYYKIDVNNTKYNTIKCPYCRNVFDNILPYYEIQGIKRITGINHPSNKILNLHTCEWKFKSGKNKGNYCCNCANKYKIGNYCDKHYKQIQKRNLSTNNTCEAILKSGKNKGKMCGCNIKDPNEKYCKKHLKCNN